jgi:plasmid replication initiation protein
MNLGYEEIKEGRKVVAIKFIFNKTKIHKVTNQKTGVEKNLYIKPRQLDKKAKKKNETVVSDVLEGEISFQEKTKEPKSIQNVLSKMFNQFKS